MYDVLIGIDEIDGLNHKFPYRCVKNLTSPSSCYFHAIIASTQHYFQYNKRCGLCRATKKD